MVTVVDVVQTLKWPHLRSAYSYTKLLQQIPSVQFLEVNAALPVCLLQKPTEKLQHAS